MGAEDWYGNASSVPHEADGRQGNLCQFGVAHTEDAIKRRSVMAANSNLPIMCGPVHGPNPVPMICRDSRRSLGVKHVAAGGGRRRLPDLMIACVGELHSIGLFYISWATTPSV
jgi:tryptophan synthase beta subunit